MKFKFLHRPKKTCKKKSTSLYAQTTTPAKHFKDSLFYEQFGEYGKFELFKSIRNSIPVVDAAFEKIKRLIGSFTFSCNNQKAEKFLNEFCNNIKVGASLNGLSNFVCSYLDNLLMFGNSVGEIVFDSHSLNVKSIYIADINNIVFRQQKNLNIEICTKKIDGQIGPPVNNKKILFTALNPPPGKIKGKSIMECLPFVSENLKKIYDAIGANFNRIGKVRYSITINPGNNELDRAYAKERAELIAKEWSKGMSSPYSNQVSDFIAVGDVKIKAIGAENQLIDCQIPAKQMLEQIIAKLSIPPFMLGLSWSTTERMSEQQANCLSKELEYYRRLLNPIILKIANTILRTNGFSDQPKIIWEVLNFNDQINAAKTRLFNAQAQKIELENLQALAKI